MCNNYENNKKKKPSSGAVWPLLFYIFLRRNMNVSLSWPQGGGGATAQMPRWLRKLTLAENLQTGAPSYLLSLTLSSPWFTTHTAFICCCCHPRSAPARVLASFSFPSQLSVCLVHLPLETNWLSKEVDMGLQLPSIEPVIKQICKSIKQFYFSN